jgi:hypothetical protein
LHFYFYAQSFLFSPSVAAVAMQAAGDSMEVEAGFTAAG